MQNVSLVQADGLHVLPPIEESAGLGWLWWGVCLLWPLGEKQNNLL